ncbi:unnamed protein product [Bursaphelenchus xylophilus]|uniref:(pine wood nematode) hypothetical protein n=1 Tax=Bursaphelenchus xylophilus TaxID=6326 RepID=A0A1I7RV21_BURXY|nr:unnamed protein product [Bursaphelenchus xylophilus]CAG9105193.1 unnamed protein product [Bursaphelenchus xylophilus]
MAPKSSQNLKKKASQKPTKSGSQSSLSSKSSKSPKNSAKTASRKSSKKSKKAEKNTKNGGKKGFFSCCCKKKKVPPNHPKNKVPAPPSLRDPRQRINPPAKLSKPSPSFSSSSDSSGLKKIKPKVDSNVSSLNDDFLNAHHAPLEVMEPDKISTCGPKDKSSSKNKSLAKGGKCKRGSAEKLKRSEKKSAEDLDKTKGKSERVEKTKKKLVEKRKKSSSSSSINSGTGKKGGGDGDKRKKDSDSDEEPVATTNSDQWKPDEDSPGGDATDRTEEPKVPVKKKPKAEVTIVKKRPRHAEGKVEMLDIRIRETDKGIHEDINFVTSCGTSAKKEKSKKPGKIEQVEPTQGEDEETEGEKQDKFEPVPKIELEGTQQDDDKLLDIDEEPDTADSSATKSSSYTSATPSTTISTSDVSDLATPKPSDKAAKKPKSKPKSSTGASSKTSSTTAKTSSSDDQKKEAKKPKKPVEKPTKPAEKPTADEKTPKSDSKPASKSASEDKSKAQPSSDSSEISDNGPVSPTTENILNDVCEQLKDRKRLQQLMQVCRKYAKTPEKADEEFVKNVKEILADIVKDQRNKGKKSKPPSRRSKRYIFDEKSMLGADGMANAQKDAEDMMVEVVGLMYFLSAECRNDYMTLVQEIYISVYHVRKWLAEKDAKNLWPQIVEATYVMERARNFHKLLREFHLYLVEQNKASG